MPHNPVTGGPIHLYFGLSYDSHLVRDRSLLQSMPTEWQEKFVGLLQEFDDAYSHIDADEYEIKTVKWTTIGDLDDDQRKQLGITSSMDDLPPMPENPTEEEFNAHEAAHDDAAMNEVFHDADGNERDQHYPIAIPVPAKIPGYRRGRTYIEPRLS